MEEIELNGRKFQVRTLGELVIAESPKKMLFLKGPKSKHIWKAEDFIKSLEPEIAEKADVLSSNFLMEGGWQGKTPFGKGFQELIRSNYDIGFCSNYSTSGNFDLGVHSNYRQLYNTFGKDKSFILTSTIRKLIKNGESILRTLNHTDFLASLPSDVASNPNLIAKLSYQDGLSEKMFITMK